MHINEIIKKSMNKKGGKKGGCLWLFQLVVLREERAWPRN